MDAIDPTANPADMPKLDENGNPILTDQPPSIIAEEIMQDMKNVWSVFDTKNEDKVTISELKTIMRALDVNLQNDEQVNLVK